MSLEDARTRKRSMPGLPVRGLRASVVEGKERGLLVTPEGGSLAIGTSATNELVLTDPTVSRFHLEVSRRGSELALRDPGSTNGTRVGAVRFSGAEVLVAPGTRVTLGDTTILLEDSERYVMTGHGPESFGGLVGRSAALRTATETLAKVAPTDLSVLLSGESGTGKELAARALHDASPRAERPFVTVDCGAIAPSLFASELFGHERGSFTGADRRHAGAFERAHGGTLFLDEVGELGPELQAALLGALERRRVRRVGGSEEITVDVRVICATHRDLRAAVNAGTFRLDLYYRLATVRVTLPPLRDRPDDVPVLVGHVLAELGRESELDALFPADAMATLRAHDWPGNVRELRNVVLGALALGSVNVGSVPPPSRADGAVGSSAVGSSAAGSSAAGSSAVDSLVDRVLEMPYGAAKREVLDEFERRWLGQLMQRSSGNVRAAARDGQIERKHLTELLRRHGIKE